VVTHCPGCPNAAPRVGPSAQLSEWLCPDGVSICTDREAAWACVGFMEWLFHDTHKQGSASALVFPID